MMRDLCPYCNWRGWLGALAIFAAFAVVGTMEYEDELRYREAAIQLQQEFLAKQDMP